MAKDSKKINKNAPDVTPLPQGMRELCLYLFLHTRITQLKLSKLTGISRRTIIRWWNTIEEVPLHRKMSAAGNVSDTPIKILEDKIKHLEKQLKKAKVSEELARAEIDPESILNTMMQKMKDSIQFSKLGELAQASRAILEIEKAKQGRKSSVPAEEPEWVKDFKKKMAKISIPALSSFDKGEIPNADGKNHEQ